MKKVNYRKAVKVAAGSCAAILIAQLLGVEYSTSAGIITLLTIQDTKKETIAITVRRLLLFVITVLASYLFYGILGHETIVFGLLMLVVVIVGYAFGLEDGLSICAVIATHFLVGKSMSAMFLWNEILLLVIGTTVGVLLNLFIPRNTQAIRQDQLKIEEDMTLILRRMSEVLLRESKEDYNGNCFEPLEKHIERSLERAYEEMNNTLLSDTRYYIHYIEMRQSQCLVLRRIYLNICNLDHVPRQTYPISRFIRHVGNSFHEFGNAIRLSEEWLLLQAELKEEPLPVTRQEFENRAVLQQIVSELEEFLQIKKDFIEDLTESQLKVYWAE